MHLQKLFFSPPSHVVTFCMCNCSESVTLYWPRRNFFDILCISYNISETESVSFVMCNWQEKPDPRFTLQPLISVTRHAFRLKQIVSETFYSALHRNKSLRNAVQTCCKTSRHERCSDSECPRLFNQMSVMRTVNWDSLYHIPYPYQLHWVNLC